MNINDLMKRVGVEDPTLAPVAELVKLGYRADLSPVEAENAILTGVVPKQTQARIVADYQESWKPDLDDIAARTYGRELRADGTLGRVTIEHVLARICGTPDRQYAADGTLIEFAKWPDSCYNDIRIYLDGVAYAKYSMGLDFASFRRVYDRAIAHIMQYAMLTMKQVETKAEGRVYVGFERLGGSTLAWSHLANNSCGNKEQRYTVRSWVEDYVFLVMVHEILHLLGCPHTPGNFIMNPSIVPSLKGMTDRDKENLWSQGYEKRTATDPPVDPKPPTDPDPEPPTPGTGFKGHVITRDGTRIEGKDIAEIVSHIKLV